MLPAMEALFFEDVEVGDEIPAITKTPSNLQLFMFSAVTWNCHRIHFDADFARGHDRLPDVLTQRPLLGSFLCQLLSDWVGENGKLERLEWSNRGPAVPGDTLTCRGKVVGKRRQGDKAIVECEVWIEKGAGETIVPGKAAVSLACRVS
jgi:hydroxyacyl-ACP dehydratase HTD2-like protein with hotdog domain